MSPTPKDYRLFHYTSRLDFLVDILTKGIWPRYCVEEFSWLFGSFTCIAFPVICFCDIPLAVAVEHRRRYGRYAIAISKDLASTYDIHPVWYIQEGTTIEKHLSTSVAHKVRPTLATIPPSLKPILPFLKPTIGAQPDRRPGRADALELLAFEEELEWRHTPPNLISTWKFGYNREIVMNADHAASNASRMKIELTHIEAVYAPTQTDVDSLLALHPILAGKIMMWP